MSFGTNVWRTSRLIIINDSFQISYENLSSTPWDLDIKVTEKYWARLDNSM